MKSDLDGKSGDGGRRDAHGELENFGPEVFFRRAAGRVLSAPTVGDAAAAGDHVLNPQLAALESGGFRDAAVLVPVVARGARASVLLTERMGHLSSHAGQVAFPGGKIDAGDADPAQAALREAQEEIGLEPEMVEVIGYLDTYLSRTGFRIVPVLARVSARHTLTINPDEVADVFEVPLAYLLNRANHHRASRVLMGREAFFYEISFEGRYIWGVTAGIIRALTNRMAD